MIYSFKLFQQCFFTCTSANNFILKSYSVETICIEVDFTQISVKHNETLLS